MISIHTNRHNAVTYHRLRPWQMLGEPYEWVKDNLNKETKYLVTNNTYKHPDLKGFKKWMQDVGITFIFDVDDYWHIDRWNPAYNAMQKKLTEHLDTIAIADIITTTHDRLATKIREINPKAEIVIIPNGLDHTDPQWSKQEVKEVSFGYVGGITHKRDLDELRGAQDRIDILAPEYFKNKLRSSRYYEYTTTSNYGYVYNNFTVSLAPIYETTFSSLKSDLKAVEAGFKNRMLVASRCHPYLDNDAIKLAKGYTDWNGLKSLELSEVQDYAGRLHEWATKERKLEDLNKIRKQIAQV